MNFIAMNKRFGKLERKHKELEERLDKIVEEVKLWQGKKIISPKRQ